MEVKLGLEYVDRITGFKGVATARTQYLEGCDRILLEAKKTDNDIVNNWFDVTRLLGILSNEAEIKPGGPGPTAPRRDPAGK
jgi:hypothetical protein